MGGLLFLFVIVISVILLKIFLVCIYQLCYHKHTITKLFYLIKEGGERMTSGSANYLNTLPWRESSL